MCAHCTHYFASREVKHSALLQKYNLYTFFGANGCFFCHGGSQRVERRQGFHPYTIQLGHQSEKRFATLLASYLVVL